MKYAVDWAEWAEQELTAVWLAANDRTAVTRAAAALDRQLQTDPSNVGESREDPERVTNVAPLGANFVVDDTARTVRVVRVWYIRPARRRS